MVELGEWLLEQGKKRRIDGEHDCATFPANWAVAVGWRDPMAKWRGAYASESEAVYLIEAAGGLSALFDEGLGSVGIERRLGAAKEGDIGVISMLNHEAGAIFTGKRWAFVLERGIAFVSIEDEYVKAIWAVK